MVLAGTWFSHENRRCANQEIWFLVCTVFVHFAATVKMEATRAFVAVPCTDSTNNFSTSPWVSSARTSIDVANRICVSQNKAVLDHGDVAAVFEKPKSERHLPVSEEPENFGTEIATIKGHAGQDWAPRGMLGGDGESLRESVAVMVTFENNTLHWAGRFPA